MPTKKEIKVAKERESLQHIKEHFLDKEKMLMEYFGMTEDEVAALKKRNGIISEEDGENEPLPEVVVIAGMPFSGGDALYSILSVSSMIPDGKELFVGPKNKLEEAKLATIVGDLRDNWNTYSALKEDDLIKLFESRWQKLFLSGEQKTYLMESVREVFLDPTCSFSDIAYTVIREYYSTSIDAAIKDDFIPVLIGPEYLPLLETLRLIFGPDNVKVLIPIHDFEEILAAQEIEERTLRATATPPSEKIDYVNSQSLMGRAIIFSSNKHVIGQTANRVHDAVNRGHSDVVKFVPYETLATQTKETIAGVYEFLGIPTDMYDSSIVHPLAFNFERHADVIFPDGMIEPYKQTWKLMGITK